MSIHWTTRPIGEWPGARTKASARKRAPFKVSFDKARRALDRELALLGAARAVLEMECSESDIRLDGFLRAGAKLRGQGVIVSFDARVGPLRYACDQYTEWAGNLRAIGLTLESLRAVERYGATKRGEQYRGYAALPAPAPTLQPMTFAEACAWIANCTDYSADVLRADRPLRGIAYRSAMKVCHPDLGGSVELWNQLTHVKAFLDI